MKHITVTHLGQTHTAELLARTTQGLYVNIPGVGRRVIPESQVRRRSNPSTDPQLQGWPNRATWAAQDAIKSDPVLLRRAITFMADYRGRSPYKDFIRAQGLSKRNNVHGEPWLAFRMRYGELNDWMRHRLSWASEFQRQELHSPSIDPNMLTGSTYEIRAKSKFRTERDAWRSVAPGGCWPHKTPPKPAHTEHFWRWEVQRLSKFKERAANPGGRPSGVEVRQIGGAVIATVPLALGSTKRLAIRAAREKMTAHGMDSDAAIYRSEQKPSGWTFFFDHDGSIIGPEPESPCKPRSKSPSKPRKKPPRRLKRHQARKG